MSIRIRPSVVPSLSAIERDDLLEALDLQTVRLPWSGCWIWTGYTLNNGYGVTDVLDEKKVVTHRLTYELTVGIVPPVLQLDHLCRVRCCRNPAHLEPVTHRENVIRGVSLQKCRETWLARTHCNHGHELSGANVKLSKQGHRSCRTCQNLYSNLSHKKQRVIHS